METFLSRYKNPLTLALVLLLQFCLLAIQVRPRLPGAAAADQAGVRVLRVGVHTVVTPPEKVLHSSGLSLRGVWSGYVDLLGVRERNEQLEAENQQLQLEQAALAEDARQGRRLQELLAFKQHYIDATVPAQVVGASGSDHERTLNLDKGSSDGIAPGMPVITPDGIVGRVRDVSPGASQVLEISDPTSATGVLLEDTRTRGVLRGNTVGEPEIVNVMPDDRIKPGQQVLTSGGDRIFPRGLPVGVVKKVVPDLDNQPLVDVILKPAANLSRLEEVLVVTGTADAPTARARQDLSRSEGAAAAIKAANGAKAAEAAEAALEAQRASDVLAARLPSASNVENPDAPDAAPGASPATADSAAVPLHPPGALHSDHYSPGTAPKAADLTPGARATPLAEGVPETERAIKAQGTETTGLPSPAVSPAFRAAHDAAMAARSRVGAKASPGMEGAAGRTASAPIRAAGPGGVARGAAGVSAASRAAAAAAPARPSLPKPANAGAIPAASGIRPRAAAVAAGGGAAASAASAGRTSAGAPRTAVSGSAGLAARSASPSSSVSGRTAAPRTSPPTRVVEDGPLPPAQPAQAAPRSAQASGTPAPPRRNGPEIVPDDGSRPPAPARAPQSAPPQPATPPEPR